MNERKISLGVSLAKQHAANDRAIHRAAAAMDEIVAHCGGCEKPLRDDQIAYRYLDNDPVMCADCAPTQEEHDAGVSGGLWEKLPAGTLR